MSNLVTTLQVVLANLNNTKKNLGQQLEALQVQATNGAAQAEELDALIRVVSASASDPAILAAIESYVPPMEVAAAPLTDTAPVTEATDGAVAAASTEASNTSVAQ